MDWLSTFLSVKTKKSDKSITYCFRFAAAGFRLIPYPAYSCLSFVYQ